MTAFRRTLTTIDDLADAGFIPQDRAAALVDVGEQYAVAITPAMAQLIDPADVADPIARQFIPDARELDRLPIENDDPIGDGLKSPVRGIVHRYPDRVLLKLVSVCPVYCRFCFRREMVGPGKSAALSEADLAVALDYIRAHSGIWEVILTGGDPLILSPRRVAEITSALGEIPHVKVLRWHSRVPAVAPERVTPQLVEALRASSKAAFIALHANHPRELTAAAREACARLIDGGIALVSQSVLLKGVNDDADTLETLMRTFVEMRIKPYYLHHGDLAPGTAHLRTTIAHGQNLMRELRGRLSGLALPTYVLDIPGAHGKVPIGPQYIGADASTEFVVTDRTGTEHHYSDCAPPDRRRATPR
ncbi:lysine 2,3-aminomutase [Hyphomicrobium sp. 1Nfss2.1]|uniref:lysine-2,3-aminomutase-like protein n=1 Tax=Hyphomicrobium sp. 1Nfss2.1 TaxID=3413936 RepID=UPI003C7E2990